MQQSMKDHGMKISIGKNSNSFNYKISIGKNSVPLCHIKNNNSNLFKIVECKS